jgi:hypothetical protein
MYPGDRDVSACEIESKEDFGRYYDDADAAGGSGIQYTRRWRAGGAARRAGGGGVLVARGPGAASGTARKSHQCVDITLDLFLDKDADSECSKVYVRPCAAHFLIRRSAPMR